MYRLWYLSYKWFFLTLQEVTSAINMFPGIVDSSVYGIRLPNHDGRAGCAAIVLASSAAVELSGLADLQSILPAFATPLFIRVVEDLQLTGNMKHQKNLLREEGVDPEK